MRGAKIKCDSDDNAFDKENVKNTHKHIFTHRVVKAIYELKLFFSLEAVSLGVVPIIFDRHIFRIKLF